MDNLEFRQITKIDKDNLDIMTNWMYKWWGQEDGYTFDGVNGEYNLQSIEKYYEFLKGSTREKDKARIPLIEDYMKNR